MDHIKGNLIGVAVLGAVVIIAVIAFTAFVRGPGAESPYPSDDRVVTYNVEPGWRSSR